MLLEETEQKLIDLFYSLGKGEEEIELFRENIENINPIQLFFIIDKDSKGYINKQDIYEFLLYNNIKLKFNEIDFIIFFYDKDNDGILNFCEFLDIFISDNNYFYKKHFRKKYKINNIEPQEMNAEIELNILENILKIFIKELRLAHTLSDLINNLKLSNDFNIENIFFSIKSYSYITTDSIKAFFDRNNISYNEKIIKGIFRRFNSKDIINKICFNKIKQFFDLTYPDQINYGQMASLNNCNTSDIIYNNNAQFNTINNNKTISLNEDDINYGKVIKSIRSPYNNLKLNEQSLNMSNYQFFLRDKRTKSLEKSLSKSLSRNKELSPKQNIPINYGNNKNSNNILKENNLYIKPFNQYNNRNNSSNNLTKKVHSKNLTNKIDENFHRKFAQNNKYNFTYNNNYFEPLIYKAKEIENNPKFSEKRKLRRNPHNFNNLNI